LTDDEIARVLAALERDRHHARNHALLVLGCRTGFRISELLSLRLGDVWREEKVLSEVEVARRYMKGKRRSRRLPLHQEARTALEPWIRELLEAGATSSTPLFPSGLDFTRPLNRRSAWKLLKRAYRHCELSGKLATHTMRKVFARRMRKATGGDLRKIQLLLGHSELETTVKYLEDDENELNDAVLK
jgi:site-specific recombinase XerD